MASTVYAEIALRARVGKCPEGGLGLEWYARGAFGFDTSYITYASEKSTVESFFSHFQIPIRGSGATRDHPPSIPKWWVLTIRVTGRRSEVSSKPELGKGRWHVEVGLLRLRLHPTDPVIVSGTLRALFVTVKFGTEKPRQHCVAGVYRLPKHHFE